MPDAEIALGEAAGKTIASYLLSKPRKLAYHQRDATTCPLWEIARALEHKMTHWTKKQSGLSVRECIIAMQSGDSQAMALLEASFKKMRCVPMDSWSMLARSLL